MSRRSHVTLRLCLLGAVALTPQTAADSRTLIESLQDALEAQPADCPDDLERHGSRGHAVCATTPLKASPAQQAVKSVLTRTDEVVPIPGKRWTKQGQYRRHRFFYEQELFVVLLEPGEGRVVFIPAQSCLSAEKLRTGGVFFMGEEGVDAPELRQRVQPAYPGEARDRSSDGLAVVQAVVRTNGQIGEVCLLYELPESHGFGAAALDAVRRWRYDPGKKDGAPAEVAISTIVSFELHP